ncbi:hypothetical protein PHLCEN_2v3189 [Hermanssonia centrifuga]|uniref:Uncharacterized protein n=1 Tax=Hermanssonia centrifuga TaxID=98765 RepID=A0A2R6R0Y2_9APHY|nr:hypothetical protein PHLCEN_2v3189 [Hermanssonia centrifuga]
MASGLPVGVWTQRSGCGMLRLGRLFVRSLGLTPTDAYLRACLALLQAHAALVCQLQLSPTILVTGGSDGRVITFSLPFNFASSSPPPPSQEPSTPPKVFPVIQRLSAHDSSVTGLQLDSCFLVTGEEMCEPSEGVWKVACTGETCVVMSKQVDKTWVEIWTFKPQEEG